MRTFLLTFLLPSLLFAFAVFSGLIIYRATWFVQDKHFSLLAQGFLHGDLFLSPINLPPGDYADFYGKQYLFFGPIPSILLMPFVFFAGKNFPQMTLSISSLLITYAVIFTLCKNFKFKPLDCFWLANFFVFGTVLYFVGLVNISAYVVQAVGTAFLVLSILEYFTKRRWLIMGLLVAAAGATRNTLFGISVFFLLEILRQRKKIHLRKSLVLFLVPILFSISMLGIYNFRRFHSFFDSGYTRNVSAIDKSYYNWKYGFFSPIHIPANLYALLIKAPEPVTRDNVQFVLKFPYLKADGMGLSIFFTSPLFIYLIMSKRKSYTISAIVAIVILVMPSLVYWGIGTSQYGYRYSLDFLPLLFLILLSAFRPELPNFAKVLIVLGIVFNCFYMLSIWNSYPLLNFLDYLPK